LESTTRTRERKLRARGVKYECNGKWKSENIRKLFQQWTSGEDLPHRTKGTGQNEWFTPDKWCQIAPLTALKAQAKTNGLHRTSGKNFPTSHRTKGTGQNDLYFGGKIKGEIWN